ncbi:MAG: substrate-binding domain-containing protein [Actinomycetota bacterium]|nr:substrate-binding domain-containing protein [Actinomycetota bacterium]
MAKSQCINYVVNDDYYGGKLAAQHLIKMGHTNVGFVTKNKIKSLKDRCRGSKDVLKSSEVESDNVIDLTNLFNKEEIRIKKKKLIEKKGITAIFAGTDIIAIEILNYVTNNLKLKVPEDLSIIGYDNINITSMVRVPLTTINQPKYSLGRLAVKQLLEIIDQKDENIIRR